MIPGRFRQAGTESEASSAAGRCGLPGSGGLRRSGTACPSGPSCTAGRLSERQCCLCCRAARCRRSPVCCCSPPLRAGRSSSTLRSLCSLNRSSSEWPPAGGWHRRHRSSPETCTWGVERLGECCSPGGNFENKRGEAVPLLPQLEFVGFFSETRSWGELHDFAEQDVDDGVAELLEQDADCAFSYAERLGDGGVLVLGGQQGQRHGYPLLQRDHDFQVGIFLHECGPQRVAQVVECSLAHVELFLELGFGETGDFYFPEPETPKQMLRTPEGVEWGDRTNLLIGGSLHGGRPPLLGEGSKERWCLSSLSCSSRSRSNILERRRRRALRSISRVEAIYEFKVTRNADETWTNCMTSSGGIGKSSRLLACGGSLIFIWAPAVLFRNRGHPVKDAIAIDN